jgi:hypothetical protein
LSRRYLRRTSPRCRGRPTRSAVERSGSGSCRSAPGQSSARLRSVRHRHERVAWTTCLPSAVQRCPDGPACSGQHAQRAGAKCLRHRSAAPAESCQPRAISPCRTRSPAGTTGHRHPAAHQAQRTDPGSRKRSSKLTVRVRFSSPAPHVPVQVSDTIAEPGPFCSRPF